jgi:hypothetical protein|tara:strand:- start:3868 stop:4050 length:183 start_codon:yes stop_codon:yes gene_type:complete
MKVYVPDKKANVISEVMQDLYMLKKAIDYQSGTAAGRINMVDAIRDKLKVLLQRMGQPKE